MVSPLIYQTEGASVTCTAFPRNTLSGKSGTPTLQKERTNLVPGSEKQIRTPAGATCGSHNALTSLRECAGMRRIFPLIDKSVVRPFPLMSYCA